MAAWQKAVLLLVVGTVLGWLVYVRPVDTGDDEPYEPYERRLME